MIHLIFPMEPVPKARARVVVRDGKVRAYTPDKTAAAEEFIRASAISWANRQGVKRFPIFEEGLPIRMRALFIRSRPKSLPKRVLMPTSRPDLDNYTKLLKDSIRGIIYHDDSDVVGELAEKEYVEDGGIPRVELTVWEALERDMPVKEVRRGQKRTGKKPTGTN
jgi:Holliday junction resolvase RusA-like endonuclease